MLHRPGDWKEGVRLALRPVLVGQAPGPNTDPDLPLYPLPRGSAGGRLADYMGLSLGQYLRTFERVNLLREYPGARGVKHSRTVDHQQDRFPAQRARTAANALRPMLAGRHVLLMGRGVAKAFGLEEVPYLQARVVPMRRPTAVQEWTAIVGVVPHPSGRNRWMNDAANAAALRAFLESWCMLFREHNEQEKSLPFAAE